MIAAPIAIAVAVFLMLRGCGKKPESGSPTAQRKALFVPADLGRLKKLDRDGVLEYCRTQIRPAKYDGFLRGAHGALWAGEANAWDRVLLAAEALEGLSVEMRIVPGDVPRLAYRDGTHWTTVRVDAAAAAETRPKPPPNSLSLDEFRAKHGDMFHTIQPVIELATDKGNAAAIEVPQQLLADWVRQPVVLRVIAEGETLHYVLDVGGKQSPLTQGPLKRCRRATLKLTWRYKNQSAAWERVLFDRGNIKPAVPGHDAPRAGDCYAIVIASGPLLPEVLETRERMFELPGYTPVDDPARELLRLGVKYQVDCDERAHALAKECKVDVAWTTPRVTMVAAEAAADGKGKSGLTMDALADSVEAAGPHSREFYVAHGLADDLVESRVLYEARRKPVISTSTVFSNFKADSPDSPVRRVARIAAEARRMLADEPIGSSTILTALPARSQSVEKTTAASRAFPANADNRAHRGRAGPAWPGAADKSEGALG